VSGSEVPTLPPPLRLGSNLADYVRLAGDQVVVVPNGTYRGESVTAAHPATSGPLKGWLVLVAESKHGAVVDLTGSALRLESGTSRVMFVGFKFVNGSIFVNGTDITFWHTDHTFPANVWRAQAPDPNNPDAGYYRAPRTVYVDFGAQRVRFAGSDLHDTCGAVKPGGGAADIILEGVHVWAISDMGLDPNDICHADAITAVGGLTTRFTVRDSWIQGRMMFQDVGRVCGSSCMSTTLNQIPTREGGGPHAGLLFERSWFSHSGSDGFVVSSIRASDPRGIFGVRRDLYSWGHNGGHDRIDIVADTSGNLNSSYTPNFTPARINVIDTNIIKTAPPAGATSPAEAWRATHPLTSWNTALG
jgi:hypothetical protein